MLIIDDESNATIIAIDSVTTYPDDNSNSSIGSISSSSTISIKSIRRRTHQNVAGVVFGRGNLRCCEWQREHRCGPSDKPTATFAKTRVRQSGYRFRDCSAHSGMKFVK